MSDKQEAPKTKFQMFLEWAKRDQMCALIGVIALLAFFPHFADFVLNFTKLLLPAVTYAMGLK
jgi:hypothetical protein